MVFSKVEGLKLITTQEALKEVKRGATYFMVVA